MSDQPQEIIERVLVDDMRVCDSGLWVLSEIPCLQDAMMGSFDYALPEEWWWWYADTFIDDPSERARMRRVTAVPRRLFLDLAQLHHAATGEATQLPEKIIRAIQCRQMAAMRPSVYEITTGAKHHPTAKASQTIARLTTEEAFRTPRPRIIYG